MRRAIRQRRTDLIGVYLLVTGMWVTKLLGLVLALLGVECRPRFTRLAKRVDVLEAAQAPQLCELVRRVGDELGAPAIKILIVDQSFNAACGRVGVRGRPMLCIGLPLWGALSPAGRLALLGHELGHLVNGDPTTGFLTAPALTTFARLAAIFNPRGFVGTRRSFFDLFTLPLAYLICTGPYLLFRWTNDRLNRIAARDHRRAEAYADALAVRIGGTAGAGEVMQVLLFEPLVRTVVRGLARQGRAEPSDWSAEVAALRERHASATRRFEQLSMRHGVSAYASHPPTGLRLRLVRRWPTVPAGPVIPDELFAAADQELATRDRQLRHDFLS